MSRINYRRHRLKALSLFSLHTAVYALSSTFFMWKVNTLLASAQTPRGTLPTLENPSKPPSASPPSILNPPPSALPPSRVNPSTLPPPPAPVIIPSSVSQPSDDVEPPIANPPEPLEVNPTTQFNRYRLGPGDSIAVLVQRFPDLNFQATINPEGNIIVPLAGEISLEGLTLQEAQEKIRYELNRFVIDPSVRLTLAAQRQTQITVTGEVTRPGFYLLPPGSQITAALLTSGGATTVADLRSIVIRRSLIDGSTIEQKVDLFTPLQNGQSLPELRLQNGDSVYVPKLEVGTTQDYDRVLVSRSSVAQQQINVRVLSYANGGIGRLTLPNGSNFIDALTAIAPNPDNANLRKISLIRFDPEQGKAVSQELDGKRVLLGDVSQNVPLQNNDVIVIGRSLVARIGYALNIFTQPFRDVLGFLLFFDSLRGSATNLFSPNPRNFQNR